MSELKKARQKPVLGLDRHPTRIGMYVRNDEELKIVETIMRKFCELKSYKSTIEYCKKQGYKTKVRMTKETISKNGEIIPSRELGDKDFSSDGLKVLLLHPKYRGVDQFKDTWNQFPKLQDASGFVKWQYPHGQLLGKDLLEEVERVVASIENTHKHLRENDFLLSGILKEQDGSSYTGEGAKSGEHIYYFNKKYKRRFRRESVEDIVCARVKKYLRKSEILDDVLSMALKHALSGLPFVAQEIKKEEGKIQTLEQGLRGFQESLRQVAAKSPSNLPQVIGVLLEERKKLEEDLKNGVNRIEQLKGQQAAIKSHFRGDKLKHYLEAVLIEFDNKNGIEKKRIIQAIIPRAEVMPNNQLKLYVNPAPTLEKGILHNYKRGCINLTGSAGMDHQNAHTWKHEEKSSTSYRYGRWNESPSQQHVPPDQLIDTSEFSWIPRFLDREFLHQKYVIERLSTREIATLICSSKTVVLKYLRHFGIPLRESGVTLRPHCLPYGMKTEKRRQVIFKREMDALQKMIELRSQGFTYEAIAQVLNSMKVPTKTHKGKWHRKTVQAILAAQFNQGEDMRKSLPLRSCTGIEST